MTEIEVLLELLKTHPAGTIDSKTDLGAKVIDALVNAWPNLPGSSDQSTSSDKLWRAEDLRWSPPQITFCLERHGGTVNGSSRADLHYWVVDVKKGEARIARQTYRQLEQNDSRLDCSALARVVADAIGSGDRRTGLVWDDGAQSGEQSVTLKIAELIPTTNLQTTTARRKRFRKALLPLMDERGWEFRPKGNVMRFCRPQRSTE